MLYAIVAVLILILDQATKYWTTLNIALDTGTKDFIPGVVHFANIHNYGAAYGFLQNARWFFVILTVIFAAAVIVLLAIPVIKGKFGRWMVVVVLAGALGNCIDRLFLGYVVDMIELEFISFPVFNVADIFITLGGIAFCLYVIFHKDEEDEEGLTAAEQAERDKTRRMRGKAVEQQQVANIDNISRDTGRFQAVRQQTDVAEVARTAEDARRRRPAQHAAPQHTAQHAAGRHAAQPQRQQARPVQQPAPEKQAVPIAFDPSDPFAEWEHSSSGASASKVATASVKDPVDMPEYSAPAQKPAETRPRPQYKPAVSYSVPSSEPVRRPAPQPQYDAQPARKPAYSEPVSEPTPAPAPKAEPAPVQKPAAKADDMDFSLEDILAEFKDI